MTKLDIANAALIRLGANTINSLTENTPNAKVCNLRFDWCKRTILRMHLWNFAMRRVSLPSVAGDTPPFEYEYSHNLPALCLRIVECSAEDYRVEGRQILTNNNGVDLRYVEDLNDFTAADQLLVESITTYFAWDIALKVTQSNETRQLMFDAWSKLHIKAKSADAQEQPAGEVKADTFIGARVGVTNPDPRTPLRDYPEYPLP